MANRDRKPARSSRRFFLIKKNKPNNEEKPPKNAPQLDIENPGSQDDFPKPPMESEIG